MTDAAREEDGADDPPEDHRGVEGETTPGGSGKPFLLLAGAVATAFVATAGYVLAANNAVEAIRVFGLLVLPGTPVAMAAYGVVLSVSMLAVLFGLVTLAAAREDGRH